MNLYMINEFIYLDKKPSFFFYCITIYKIELVSQLEIVLAI